MKQVIIDKDMATFIPALQGAVLFPPMPYMAPITGSGTAKISGKPICIEGDEESVSLTAGYMAPGYPIPGSGTLTIKELGGDQLTKKTTCDGEAVIILGTTFKVEFKVSMKAMQLPPPASGGAPHSSSSFEGTGKFVNTNMFVTYT